MQVPRQGRALARPFFASLHRRIGRSLPPTARGHLLFVICHLSSAVIAALWQASCYVSPRRDVTDRADLTKSRSDPRVRPLQHFGGN
jgi:hypothetical protein